MREFITSEQRLVRAKVNITMTNENATYLHTYSRSQKKVKTARVSQRLAAKKVNVELTLFVHPAYIC